MLSYQRYLGFRPLASKGVTPEKAVIASSLLHAFGMVLFGVAWLITDHFRPWLNFHGEALALWGLALLAWAHLANPNPWTRHAPRWTIGLLLLALLPWFQWLLGVSAYAGDAWIGSLFLCALAVAVSLGHSWGQFSPSTERLQTAFFLTLVLISLLTATIAVLQWLSLEPFLTMWAVQVEPGMRSSGNLGQPNQAATLLLMGLAAMAWAYERGLLGGVGLTLGAGWIAIAIGTTQSRAGMLGAVVAGGFLLAQSHFKSLRLRPLYILGWLAFLALWVVMLQPRLGNLLLMSGPRTLEIGVDGARMTIWKQMLYGIWHSPWWGYGVNATPTANAWGALHVPGPYTYTHGHSIVLDVLAWFGIPIGVLMTALASYWFVTRILRVRQLESIYAMACLLPLLMHSLVEFPYAYGYFWVAAGLCIGLVEADRNPATAWHWPRWAGVVIVAFWTTVGAVMTWEYVQIEEDFRYVRFESLNLGHTPPEHTSPNVHLLTQLSGMLRAGRQKPVVDMSQAALDNLGDASMRFAYPILRSLYAHALWLRGETAAATVQLGLIRGMYGETIYLGTLERMRAQQIDGVPPLPPVPELPRKEKVPRFDGLP